MKRLQGTVTSLKQQKTVMVLHEYRWQHPVYGKYVKRSKQYACDLVDKKIKLAEGDTVIIEECVPVSKSKRFKVVSKVA